MARYRIKRLIIIMVLILPTICGLFAETGSFMVRAEYFMPGGSIFKAVYGSSVTAFGGELHVFVAPAIGLWAEGSYLSKRGATTETREESTVKIIPIEVGVMYRLSSGAIAPYLGVGVGLALFSESSAAPYHDPTSASGLSVCVLAGVTAHAGAFVFDARATYRSCQVAADDGKVDIGGIGLSLGVGVAL